MLVIDVSDVAMTVKAIVIARSGELLVDHQLHLAVRTTKRLELMATPARDVVVSGKKCLEFGRKLRPALLPRLLRGDCPGRFVVKILRSAIGLKAEKVNVFHGGRVFRIERNMTITASRRDADRILEMGRSFVGSIYPRHRMAELSTEPVGARPVDGPIGGRQQDDPYKHKSQGAKAEQQRS